MSKPKPSLPSRVVRGWVVVSRTGHPLPNSTSSLRSDAIAAYNGFYGGGNNVYHDDRREYGVQVVRCTITTDPR